MASVDCAQNPYIWPSIENVAAALYHQWTRAGQRQDRVPLLHQRFDAYEKIDGTNVGMIAWPPEAAGGLLGRNYVIPDESDAYQATPLRFLRA